jgi:hypothetical protein
MLLRLSRLAKSHFTLVFATKNKIWQSFIYHYRKDRIVKNISHVPYMPLYRKSNLGISRKRIARPQTQFLRSSVCKRLYIHGIGPHIWLQQNRQNDPGNF